MNKYNANAYLPLVQALADGELEEYIPAQKVWVESLAPNFLMEPECYRRKREPKFRPWTPEEVPQWAVLLTKNAPHVEAVILKAQHGLVTIATANAGVETCTYQGLLSCWTLDGKPCGVEE